MIRNSTLFIFLIILCGCTDLKVSNNSLKGILSDYYKTNDIQLTHIDNNKISINVKNSQLVLESQAYWKTLDPFASIGALIVYKNIEDKNSFKEIQIEINKNKFEYSVSDISQILVFIDTIKSFIERINEKQNAIELLSNEISNVDREKAISSLTNIGHLKLGELNAFIIENNLMTLYVTINVGNDRYDRFKFLFNKGRNDTSIIAIHSW